MWLHYCLFACIAGLGVLYKQNERLRIRLYYISIFLVFFIFATFRAYTIGNDTPEYYRIFNLSNSSNSLRELLSATRYEVGYLILNFLVTKFTSSFTVLLALITAFYMASVLRFINKYSVDPRTTILVCFSLSAFYDVLITMRQCIAIAIFLYAIEYLIERKPLKYFALILLAITFQKSSVVLLLLYFAPRADFKRTKDFVEWCLIVIAALICVDFLSVIVGYFSPYFSHYFSSAYAEGGMRIASVLFFLVRLFCVVILWITRAFQYGDEYGGEKKVFLQLLVLECIVAGMSVTFNILDRIENFFCIPFSVIVVNVLSHLSLSNRRIGKWAVITISFVYLTICLWMRSEWYGLFPYQFQ